MKTFGRIDVDAALIDQLTGTTTITPEATNNTLALRAELKDGGPLRTALNRLAAIPDLPLELANVNLNVDRDGDTYAITRDGKAFINAAVYNTTLVVTNDLHASLRGIADRKPQQPARTAQGALTFHIDDTALHDQLITRLGLPDLARLVIGGFGDVNGWAQQLARRRPRRHPQAHRLTTARRPSPDGCPRACWCTAWSSRAAART